MEFAGREGLNVETKAMAERAADKMVVVETLSSPKPR
jgi:hypothetical protein